MKKRGSRDWTRLLCAGVATAVILCGCHEKHDKHDDDDKDEKHEKHDKDKHAKHGHEEEASKLVVSKPLIKDTEVVRDFVCQIHSSRNIEVRAVERGYLETVSVKEGQKVKEGDPMFKILPLVYQAELRRAEAEAQAATVEYQNTKRLTDTKIVSDTELAIVKAKMEKALAEVNLAQAHLGFTDIKAPFAGLVDRLHLRNGSLVDEGDLLTTLSDNSEVWVYFNVPEAEYLEYASQPQPEERNTVSLIMANGKLFDQPGRINAIEAEFNNETGTIPFRADFPNPTGLLRHGETGNIRMKKLVKGAVLVPQKATFEILDHHYVFIVGKDDVLVQQRIRISEEIEDLFIVSDGVTENDKIVVEGLRQAKGGEKATYEFEEPEKAFKNLKLRAE
jgi:membrane fusion protein (multidrug efflux system)